MQARLQDAQQHIQQLEHALLEQAPTPRGTLAAFADQLWTFMANALIRFNAIWYSLLWPESFELTAFCKCIFSPCRVREDDDKQQLTVVVGLYVFICAARVLHHRLMASTG